MLIAVQRASDTRNKEHLAQNCGVVLVAALKPPLFWASGEMLRAPRRLMNADSTLACPSHPPPADTLYR